MSSSDMSLEHPDQISSKDDVKPIIIESFNIMYDQYIVENNTWKASAYKKALKSLEQVDSVHSISDIENIKGFGKSLKAKVEEIIKTHHLKAAEEAQCSKTTQAVKELTSIHGIGIQKARSLIEKGIMSIEELRVAAINDPSLLHDQQKLGLEFYNDIKERIPHSEMKKHYEFLKNVMNTISKTAKLEVVGSFRRNAKTSGDVDVLITDYPDNEELLDSFLEALVECGYLSHEHSKLSKGKVKYCGIAKLPDFSETPYRRLDILYTHPYEYPFALLYFTGSGEFNKEMRSHALKMGYSLNQKNIQHKQTSLIVDIEEHKFECEKDIFDFLKLKYIEPPQRTSGNVISEM